MTRQDVRSYLKDNGLCVVVRGEHSGRYFTLLMGELLIRETGKVVAYAEAIARCSSLDNPNSNIGIKVALSRLDKALVKKHLGHGRALHHPLYA
jgi:hypothetical protein